MNIMIKEPEDSEPLGLKPIRTFSVILQSRCVRITVQLNHQTQLGT